MPNVLDESRDLVLGSLSSFCFDLQAPKTSEGEEVHHFIILHMVLFGLIDNLGEDWADQCEELLDQAEEGEGTAEDEKRQQILENALDIIDVIDEAMENDVLTVFNSIKRIPRSKTPTFL